MKQILKTLLAQGEGARTEFKSRVPDRKILGRVLSAFANGDGGTLVIGVDDNGKIVGAPDAQTVAESLRKDVPPMISPHLPISVNVVDVENKSLLLIDVPGGTDKPYTFERKIYVRTGSATRATKPIDVPGLRALLNTTARTEVRWERRVAAGITVSDLDSNEVDRLLNAAQTTYDYGFTSASPVLEKLESVNLAERGELCNSAVILLAANPQERFPQARVRAIYFEDGAEREVADNRVFEGHAFQLLENSLQFIQAHIPVSSVIPGDGLVREEKAALPIIAVREALLNAIQHRDYEAYGGSVIIKITPDRVIMWNPGEMPEGMTVEELKRPHYSRPRNPDIAHAFFLRGYVERIGSGTGRILNAVREAGLPDAEWQVVSGGVEVSLRYGETRAQLNTRQSALLRTLQEGETISVSDYKRLVGTGVSDRQARTDVADLVDQGFLKRRGSARSTRYERTGRQQ